MNRLQHLQSTLVLFLLGLARILAGEFQEFSSFARPLDDRVAVILFQANEEAALRLWYSYHAKIFGPENIYVMDHESTDPLTRRLLAEIQARGSPDAVTLCQGHFRRKQHCLSDRIRALQASGNYTILLPMDVDEFLVVTDLDATRMQPIRRELMASLPSQNLSSDPALIMEAIQELPRDGRAFKLNEYRGFPRECFHPPAQEVVDDVKTSLALGPESFMAPYSDHDGGTFLPCDIDTFEFKPIQAMYSKVFFYAPSFIGTDQGNHFGYTTVCGNATNWGAEGAFDRCFIRSRLGLLHFTYVSWLHFQTKVTTRSITYGFHRYKWKEQACKPGRAGRAYCDLFFKAIKPGLIESFSSTFNSSCCKGAANQAGVVNFKPFTPWECLP